MANTTAVVSQLHALEQLTRTEIQIARLRVAQARTDAVRRELRQNSDNAQRRADRIAAALRNLDAVPNLFGPAVGRVAAVVEGTVEQVQPIDEALLGDLALEHQLLGRARYLLALTDQEGPAAVHRLAEQLVTAHSATVDWLSTVLAEYALGGPPALRATPLQVVAGTVTWAVRLPVRLTVDSVNRAGQSAGKAGQQARERTVRLVERLGTLAAGTREVVATGVDAALDRAETVTRRDGSAEAAEIVHNTRRELGVLEAGELPVRRYDELSVQGAVAAVKKLDTPDEIQAVIRYEEQHKNRSGVVSAAQTRHAEIAKEAIGVS